MITFCIVDDINTYANDYIKATIKNIADFTISNLLVKGYKVITGKDEDELLKSVDTEYAVVMSPGTEYINGYAFFEALEQLVQKDFFVAGHVLDRTSYEAYYELHHQCYVVNMTHYKLLQRPTVGAFEKSTLHTQVEPARSLENWHDDYTPKFVMPGTQKRTYSHKCHGWNLLRLAFENKLPVIVFDENIRNNKKHYYPESERDYYKHKEAIEYKNYYCKYEFVHTENTEWDTGVTGTYEQLVVPASGTLYLNTVDTGRVIFYDYNEKALDYWKEHCPRKEGVEYLFVHTDLLNELSIVDYLEPNLRTLINLSNIFSYEGTAAQYSLKHRLLAQENLVARLKSTVKKIDINFTQKANPKILDIASWH